MLNSYRWPSLVVLLSMMFLTACVHDHAPAFSVSESVSEQRQLQMRKYSSGNKSEILVACVSVLQDTGYNIDETNSKLGLVSASKLRETDNSMEKASLIAMAFLANQSASDYILNADDKQNIKVSLVVTKLEDKQVVVRATFQRVVWNVGGNVSRLETIKDKTLYQGFFAKLSKAIFLEDNKL